MKTPFFISTRFSPSILFYILFSIVVLRLPAYEKSFTDSRMYFIPSSALSFSSQADSCAQQHEIPYSLEVPIHSQWQSMHNLSTQQLNRGEVLWVKIPLPAHPYKDPALYMIAFSSEFEVFYQNKLIYSNTKLHNPTAFHYYNRHVIPLPHLTKAFDVYVRFDYKRTSNLGRISSIYLGNREDIQSRVLDDFRTLLKQNMLNILLGFCLLFLGVLSLLIFFYRWKNKQYPILYFGLIAFLSGANYLLHYILFLPVTLSPYWYNALIFISRDLINVVLILFITLHIKAVKNWISYCALIIVSLLFLLNTLIIMLYPIDKLTVYALFALSITTLFYGIYVFIKLKLYRQVRFSFPAFCFFIYFLICMNDSIVHMRLIHWNKMFYEQGILFLVVGLGYLLVINYLTIQQRIHQYSRELETKQNELLRLQKENLISQYEALKTQVNPHFLFNTFNTLISLIETEQDLAIEFVQQLSNVYRYVLQTRNKELVRVKEEIDFIEAYLFLLKRRYAENIVVTINIKEPAFTYYLPPLCLQLLVENAIKHNIISVRKPLYIDIYNTEDNYIVIRNNLQKKTSIEYSAGIGLPNITERYRHFTKIPVNIEENHYHFIVSLPLLREETLNHENTPD